MYSRRVIVCDGGMVKKTLSFIGAVVVRKQKILLHDVLPLVLQVLLMIKKKTKRSFMQ